MGSKPKCQGSRGKTSYIYTFVPFVTSKSESLVLDLLPSEFYNSFFFFLLLLKGTQWISPPFKVPVVGRTFLPNSGELAF